MCIKHKVGSMLYAFSMSKTTTVKAREHLGANSLDLTIPTQIRRTFGISPGDLFLVSAEIRGKEVTVSYKRVYHKY